MLSVFFPVVRQVLCLGAHADDIEIGCGGTMLKLVSQFPELEVHWVVFSGVGKRREEAEMSAKHFLKGARVQRCVIHSFRDGFFPYQGAEIKETFELLKKESVQPDIIFTHYGEDRHQDHRLLSELTWNTFRNHLILEYEIPKYDGGLGSPSFFTHLNASESQRKVSLLLEVFRSQADKPWFSADTFDGLMRLRGMECNSPSKKAEAFYCRKMFYS